MRLESAQYSKARLRNDADDEDNVEDQKGHLLLKWKSDCVINSQLLKDTEQRRKVPADGNMLCV